MEKQEARVLRQALKTEDQRLRLLAATAGTSPAQLRQFIDGELDEEEANSLGTKLERLLALPPGELTATTPKPDAQARRAATQKLEAAAHSLKEASAACRNAGAGQTCERIEAVLARVEDAQRELERVPAHAADEGEE